MKHEHLSKFEVHEVIELFQWQLSHSEGVGKKVVQCDQTKISLSSSSSSFSQIASVFHCWMRKMWDMLMSGSGCIVMCGEDGAKCKTITDVFHTLQATHSNSSYSYDTRLIIIMSITSIAFSSSPSTFRQCYFSSLKPKLKSI